MLADKARRIAWVNAKKKEGRRPTIGFTGVSNFTSAIGRKYFEGIQQAASEYDVNCINFLGVITNSLFDQVDFFHQYQKKFQFMRSPFIDGLIIWSSSLGLFTDRTTIVRLFSELSPLPMVDLGRSEVPGVPSVRMDAGLSMQALMDHLAIDHGYTRFAFIGNEDIPPHIERLHLWRKELHRLQLKELEGAVVFTPTMGSKEIVEMADCLQSRFKLQDRTDIEVIVSPSDIIGSALSKEFVKRGILVPKDVAVSGFNNQYEGITALPPLTTMDPVYARRGYMAFELLLDRLMQQDKETTATPVQDILLPAELIVRQSCGCLEACVEAAGHSQLNSASPQDKPISIDALLLSERMDSACFIGLPSSLKQLLAEAIVQDIQDVDAPSAFVRVFQNLPNDLYDTHGFVSVTGQDCQNSVGRLQQIVSELRALALPFVAASPELRNRLEDCFHEARALISLQQEYRMLAVQDNTYNSNSKTRLAIAFSSITTSQELRDALNRHITDMEIPGLILALQEYLAPELKHLKLELHIPESIISHVGRLPLSLVEGCILPSSWISQERRFQGMFELLSREHRFLGYALVQMGSADIAWYDTIRLLLSQALSAVYDGEGRSSGRKILLNRNDIEGLFPIQTTTAEMHSALQQGGLNAADIFQYLLDHIHEMTDLERMAKALSISKSHLSRRAKALTGYSVRDLHERIKIEQAKKMLKTDAIKTNEIANRLGFQNQSYFSTVFRRVTGLSPSEWRDRL